MSLKIKRFLFSVTNCFRFFPLFFCFCSCFCFDIVWNCLQCLIGSILCDDDIWRQKGWPAPTKKGHLLLSDNRIDRIKNGKEKVLIFSTAALLSQRTITERVSENFRKLSIQSISVILWIIMREQKEQEKTNFNWRILV